jgi:hypothetical protein
LGGHVTISVLFNIQFTKEKQSDDPREAVLQKLEVANQWIGNCLLLEF